MATTRRKLRHLIALVGSGIAAGCGALDEGASPGGGPAGVESLARVDGYALGAENGLSAINWLSSTVGLMTNPDGRTTAAYIARCALPTGDSLVKADQNGVVYTFPGALGLAPQWKTGACNTSCQEIMSACLMAHVNTAGRHINLWLASPVAALGLGRNFAYPIQESAFFGNLFVSPPKAYDCNGSDWDRGPVAGRVGADQVGAPYTNPFGTNALCQGSCTVVGTTGEAYGTCNGYSNVITVYRDFDPTASYTLTNKSTSMVFDITAHSLLAGAVLEQYVVNGGGNQSFHLERVAAISDGDSYRIRAHQSGLYLTVAGKGDRAGVTQQAYTGAQSQLWTLIEADAGMYNISSDLSGLVLTYASTSIGAAIIQRPASATDAAQAWKINLVP
jgi:hypothetical protein